MGLLDQLFGGDSEQQHSLQDFVGRYLQGSPAEGVSGQEAADHYQQVASQLPQQDYLDVAKQAFERMSPEQREQFGGFLREQAQQANVSLPDVQAAGTEQFRDSNVLAQMAGQVHQQDPGLLGQVLGGGAMDNPVVKAAVAGIAAMAAQRFMGGRGLF